MTSENVTQSPIPVNAAKRRMLWLGFALFIVLLDQISKWAITETVFRPQLGQTGTGFLDWYGTTHSEFLPFISIPMTSFFNLVMVWNTGVSFGMFGDHGASAPLILIIMASAITLFFVIWMMRVSDHLHGFCFALIIGGAIGNIIDRARFGAVIDFLDFHAYGYHWPAFNVADMAVVVGVCLLIILSIAFDLLAKGRYRNPAS